VCSTRTARPKGSILSSPTSTAKRRAFYLASRLFTLLYGRFPLFGRLRGAIAITHNSDQVLVIDRNDGRGWCFPGGRARPGESAEVAVKREVREETGLAVTSCRFLFAFDEPIARTHVFEIQAAGELKGSWEGEPRWATLSELSAKIYSPHRPVLAYLQPSRSACP
jgi:8-oxo-dGTP pyrophosphatase MutT (NUDIX family)